MNRLIFFLVLTLGVIPAVASDVTNLLLANSCKSSNVCSPDHKKFIEQVQLKCEVERKAQQCDELEKANPTWAPLMRRCDTPTLCQQNKEYLLGKQQACLRGYKNALIDLGIAVKDMTVSLAGMVENGWENIKRNNKLRQEFLKECNKSLACKRDLVKDDHRYNTLSDEKLDKFTSTFLYIEAQDAANYQAALDRNRPRPYVPAAERFKDRDTELTADQQQKLKGLTAIVKEQVVKQYHRYSCYSDVAQEELLCYAVGNIVDPFMIGGYFAKGARLATAAGKAAHLKTEVEAAEALRVFQGRNLALSRAKLTERYLEYNPTTEAQNLAWIAKAEKGIDSDAKYFLSVENSKIRELNNTLKDKNLVTSLTNYHKDILRSKIDELQKEFPNLVIERYSDFKSMRFAFSGEIPKDLEKRLAVIFDSSNAEFSKYLADSKLVRQADGASDWFRGGLGQSADQANVAARQSRTKSSNELLSFKSDEVVAALQNDLGIQELSRQTLQRDLSKTPLVHNATLDSDVFDIVRKNPGDTSAIQKSLEQRYATKVSADTAKEIEKYVRLTDKFSPDIYIAKRELAHLNDAVYGGFSADIAGMGAANLKGTAEALATSPSIERALIATRKAEIEVTKDFKAQRDYLNQVLDKNLPGKTKTVCSGDDCVAVALAPLTEAEKTKIVQALADSRYNGRYRLSFIPEGVVEDQARNMLATHGESLEKMLRSQLKGSLPNSKLSSLTFAVDMKTTTQNAGAVKLLTGERGASLTTKERELVQKSFDEAVRKFNANSVVDQGAKTNYFALPSQ